MLDYLLILSLHDIIIHAIVHYIIKTYFDILTHKNITYLKTWLYCIDPIDFLICFSFEYFLVSIFVCEDHLKSNKDRRLVTFSGKCQNFPSSNHISSRISFDKVDSVCFPSLHYSQIELQGGFPTLFGNALLLVCHDIVEHAYSHSGIHSFPNHTLIH